MTLFRPIRLERTITKDLEEELPDVGPEWLVGTFPPCGRARPKTKPAQKKAEQETRRDRALILLLELTDARGA